MRHLRWKGLVLCAFLGMVGSVGLKAQDRPAISPEQIQKVEEALAKLPAYTFGESREALSVIEEHVRVTYGDSVSREGLAKALASVLQTEATLDAKDFACRQLSIIGSGECVPALSILLLNEDASNMARYALERLDDPSAGQALREALPKAQGKIQIGLINSLGVRKDSGAVAALASLLKSPDEAVVTAAAVALGKIGGSEALSALTSCLSSVQGSLRGILADACLLCADTLLKQGNKEEAAKIYRQFYASSEPENIRVAAFNGLVEASPEATVPLVAELLLSEDTRTQGLATRYVREMSGASTTQAFAGQLPRMTPEGRVLLMDALSARGDAAALEAITEATQDASEPVRIAALKAIGVLGGADQVPLLARFAASKTGEERTMARESMDRLKGEGVNKAMADHIGDVEAPGRVELLRSLGARRAEDSVSKLLKCTKDSEASVREEALKSLTLLAGKDEIKPLVKRLTKLETEDERGLAEKAVVAACVKWNDQDARSEPVIKAFKGEKELPVRCALLRVMGKIGSGGCLEIVRQSLDDPSSEVQDAAVRALTEWPDISSAKDLLEIAKTASSEIHRVLALRGYVRVVGLPSYRPLSETLSLLDQGMAVAQRPDDKKLVLAGFGKVGDVQALPKIEPFLTDPDLGAEAAAAAIGIAEAIASSDAEKAEAVLLKVIDTCSVASMQEKAGSILDGIQEFDDYLVQWMVAGPYMQEKKEGMALFDIPFPPEEEGNPEATWRLALAGPDQEQPWRVDLDRILQGDNRAGYLKTWVWSPSEQEALLLIGTDDGVKAWLNGEVVDSVNAPRGVTPGSDRVQVKLHQGWNTLLLKVVQGTGQWAACARFRAPRGGGLKEKLLPFGSPDAFEKAQDAARAGREIGLEILSYWPEPAKALDAVLLYLDVPSLKEKSAEAVVRLAEPVMDMPGTKTALEKAVAVTSCSMVKDKAQALLDRIKEFEDYVTVWEVSGPYTKEGKSGMDLMGEAFPPEDSSATGTEWKKVETGGDPTRPWVMNLAKIVGGENCVAYLRTIVKSATEQKVALELGSDDGIKVWLNREVVHSKNDPRSLKPGEDRVEIVLHKGSNALLLKITQGASDWAACARFKTLKNEPVKGLVFETP